MRGLPAPPPFDGIEDDDTGVVGDVGRAVYALRTFAGELTRERATTLVRMWRGYGDLMPGERLAVLCRFPRIGDRTTCRYCSTPIERTRDDSAPWRHTSREYVECDAAEPSDPAVTA